MSPVAAPRPTVRLLTPTGQTLGANMIANAHGATPHMLTSLPPNNATNLTPIVLSSVNSTNSAILNNVVTTAPNINTSLNATNLPQNSRLPVQNHQPPPPVQSSRSSHSTSTPKSKSSSKTKKEKADKKNASASTASNASATAERTTSSFRDDDDINDVAAMGGVNLQEESQRILAGNAEIIGQQIRSCKDENFLYTTPLHAKINSYGMVKQLDLKFDLIVFFLVKKFELKDCSQDVVSLISHAAQERLKTLVEKLGAIAEHRQEPNKVNIVILFIIFNVNYRFLL